MANEIPIDPEKPRPLRSEGPVPIPYGAERLRQPTTGVPLPLPALRRPRVL